MFFMVVAAVYILYLLFLIVRACSELRHMPYVGQCHFTNAQCSPGQEAASHGGGVGRGIGGEGAIDCFILHLTAKSCRFLVITVCESWKSSPCFTLDFVWEYH